MTILFTLLYSLALPAVIVIIIYLAVNGTKKGHSISRDVMIAIILLSATVSGLVGLTFIPNKLLLINSNSLCWFINIFGNGPDDVHEIEKFIP